ncbi:hypothetical protein [Acetobacter oeni]|uniref:Uncharacterized protein n=1 Tax=Acetobacter oeni TaxID=304077 RepID=A0A511XP19_9PROT|nr:hypothetical protein [Acetobacter oeni]MBB3884484.1 hypothetical protein [Acetobacter oeni]NHO20416.1 hypothetical protein [Acetobacter oeni]GBR00524.1 hypothetical protein AA21952_0130 [Acetobacter oeni LMG 21952]GEN64705.1 hypothetical protein AOE01nite_29290 [Acetobacter oeni]
MSQNVSVTFLRSVSAGGSTYNASDSASFPKELADKLVRIGVAKPYHAHVTKVSESLKKG